MLIYSLQLGIYFEFVDTWLNKLCQDNEGIMKHFHKILSKIQTGYTLYKIIIVEIIICYPSLHHFLYYYALSKTNDDSIRSCNMDKKHPEYRVM